MHNEILKIIPESLSFADAQPSATKPHRVIPTKEESIHVAQ